jgi:antirestriction protein
MEGGSSTSEATPEETEQAPKFRPQIYVASLSDYNAGHLHGAWLDATEDAEALHAGIHTMLAASREPGAEEWAIHDFDDFGGVQLSEYESLDRVGIIARGLQEHGEAFGHYVRLLDADESPDDFTGAYLGHWPGVGDFAAELLSDMGADNDLEGLPDYLRRYVLLDSAAVARDMVLGGDVTVSEDGQGVHVFAMSPGRGP